MLIAGDWYNEFGSLMSITQAPGTAGEIRGFYTSRVGEAIGAYPLVGCVGDPERSDCGVPMGWTVSWRNEGQNSFSVTCWSGQYLPDTEQILATWLLTRSTDAADQWEAAVGTRLAHGPRHHRVEQRGRP